MSTHNICFHQEIRKLYTWYPLLSRPVIPGFDTCTIYCVSFLDAYNLFMQFNFYFAWSDIWSVCFCNIFIIIYDSSGYMIFFSLTNIIKLPVLYKITGLQLVAQLVQPPLCDLEVVGSVPAWAHNECIGIKKTKQQNINFQNIIKSSLYLKMNA